MRRSLPLAILLLTACEYTPIATVTPGGPLPPVPAPEAPFGPAPLFGGTLLVLPDGRTAVASDPDSSGVWIVDLLTQYPRLVSLYPRDEPGPLIVDGAGRVQVVLRRGGALVTLDPSTASVLARRPVCPAPRGLAYDSATGLVHVACAGGELVSLPAGDGEITRILHLPADLRDVIVSDTFLIVSRFRAAQMLVLDVDGNIVATRDSPANNFNFTSSVAWRTVPLPDGNIAMLHQMATNTVVPLAATVPIEPDMGAGAPDLGAPPPPPPAPYGDPTGGAVPGQSCVLPIVLSALTVFVPNGWGPPIQTHDQLPALISTLSVDAARSADGSSWAVLSAGTLNHHGELRTFDATAVFGNCLEPTSTVELDGTGIAVVPYANGFLVQTRFPSGLQTVGNLQPGLPIRILLALPSRDAGFDVFHADSGVRIACASCHPEGGDDGRVWNFSTGARRTMSLAGGIAGSEPFHWIGDESNVAALMDDVFVHRMGGPPLTALQVAGLAGYLETIPVIAQAQDNPDAVARGKQLFESDQVGCANCHSGAHLTNNATVDVNTGGSFQVPRLTGLWNHPPYLHDGRAHTLRDRFAAGIGGGDLHGNTSQLTSSEIDDLVAYLSSL